MTRNGMPGAPPPPRTPTQDRAWRVRARGEAARAAEAKAERVAEADTWMAGVKARKARAK